MRISALILILSLLWLNGYPQNVGVGTSSPHPSARLDVSAQNQGFLPPRLTCAQRNSIQNPAAGLIIWCTDCGGTGEMQVYTGSSWMAFGLSAARDSITRSLISTKTATQISSSSAFSGGIITGDGGLPVLQRGVVWSLNPNPVWGSNPFTSDSSGTGDFTSLITGLNFSTTYYVRAYSRNVSGVTYGNQVSFVTRALDSLSVSLSRDTLYLNGYDETKITVRDPSGADVTSQSTLYANNQILSSRNFFPSDTGTYRISASRSQSVSNFRNLVVLPRRNSPFTKKILAELVTGTWSGFPPRVINKIETYQLSQPNCISIAMHGSSPDPFQFEYRDAYFSRFGISGYPTVILNRSRDWNEMTAQFDSALRVWAPLGVSISSNHNAGIIQGLVKVKFNVTTSRPLKIVIALVENGLVYPQTNYYTPQYGFTPYLYGGINPIPDFMHNVVLRKTSTNLFGDSISVAAQYLNNEISFPFSMTLTGQLYGGGSYTAIAANTAIVAFVIDDTPSQGGVMNVQYAPVGVIKDYD